MSKPTHEEFDTALKPFAAFNDALVSVKTSEDFYSIHAPDCSRTITRTNFADASKLIKELGK